MEQVYHLYTKESRTRLAIPAHEPLIGRQPFQRDRPPRVQPPRRDADFGAEAEFAAVGELRRGVVHDDRAVDSRQQTPGGPRILGDDRVGVASRQRLDMRKRSGTAADTTDRDEP